MRFDLLDDSGFIAIVNSDNYRGFVDEDWQLNQLLKYFVNQMNNHNIVIWSASEDGGNTWAIEILDHPSDKRVFRQFDFPINVTSNSLYLCPFSDLTMAAQFIDETIPQKHNSDLEIDIDNGEYKVIVRQLFDVKSSDFWESDATHFEIIFKKLSETTDDKTDKVFWLA